MKVFIFEKTYIKWQLINLTILLIILELKECSLFTKNTMISHDDKIINESYKLKIKISNDNYVFL